MKKPLEEMTPAELQKAYDKASLESSKQTTAMIEAGRGYEYGAETEGKTDPLSLAWSAARRRCGEVLAEMARRRTYSGTLKKIKPLT